MDNVVWVHKFKINSHMVEFQGKKTMEQYENGIVKVVVELDFLNLDRDKRLVDFHEAKNCKR